MERWESVPLAAFADGRALVEVDGEEILVLCVDGRAHAFANACPHRGNPLADGWILGDQLECAYHGWRFDLATGSCLVGDEPARRYEAELGDGEVRVRLGAS